MRKLLTLLILIQFAGAETSLKTVLKNGDKFKYMVKTEQTVNQIVQGRKAKQENKNSTEYFLEVVKVDNQGNTQIKCTYKAVSIFINSGLSEVKYNSRDSAQITIPQEAKPLASLLNKSFTITLSAENKVTSVKGMQELVDGMIKETVSAFSPQVKKQVEEKFRKIYGDKAVSNTMQQIFAVYPGKKVKVNDNWKSENVLESIFSFKIQNSWTLLNSDKEKAEVKLESKVTPAKTEFELNGVKLTHNVAGTQEGKYIFNIGERHLTSSTVSQVLSGAMKMNRVNIPVNISSKIIQTVTRQ